MLAVNAMFGFGVHPHHVHAGNEAHDVQIVDGQIDDDADILDARGKRPLPPRIYLEYPA